jgi:hypothetical protein
MDGEQGSQYNMLLSPGEASKLIRETNLQQMDGEQ